MLIDCKDRLTLRTAEAASAGCLESLRTYRAAENLREYAFAYRSTLLEEIDCVLQRILDVEELRESQKLEDFVYLRLNFEKNDIAALWLNHFEECSERTDSC